MAVYTLSAMLLCLECRLSIGEHQQPWRVCDRRLNTTCLDLLRHFLLATILCLNFILIQSSIKLPTLAGSPVIGSPLDSLPAVPRSDHARSLFPGVGQSWEERQQVVLHTFVSRGSTIVHTAITHTHTAFTGKQRQLCASAHIV